MTLSRFPRKAAAVLLAAAALLLPSLSLGAEDRCCPAPGAAGGCADDHRLPCDDGDTTARGGGDRPPGGEAHRKAFCDCGACDILSLAAEAEPLRSPGATERLEGRSPVAPPSEAPAAPDRPPSA